MTETPCVGYSGQLNVKTGSGTVLGTRGTNGYISWISETKECRESEFRSNLPYLPLVVFPHQLTWPVTSCLS